MKPEVVWVISELYYPEETSTGYFLTKIAEGLARRYLVKVLCSQPTYSARGFRAPVCEIRNGVSIRRCWGTTLNKDVLVFRLVNLLTITCSIFLTTIGSIRRNDMVLVVTNPPLLPFAVAVACSMRRAQCLLLVHDVYPEVLIATGILRAGSPLPRLIERLTRLLYRNVKRIIVLGRDMERLVSRKLGEEHRKVVVIPNWGDTAAIGPMPREENPLLRDLRLTGKFVVEYCGNMGRTHGLECLVECAHMLGRSDDIHFLFIGWGAKKRWLEEQVRQRRLSNVTILQACLRSELPAYLNACDVSLISFVPGMAGVSVPSRMYDLLAAGRPIVASTDEDSELATVVQEEEVGWVVPAGRPDRIAEVILEARSDPARLRDMGRRARKAAETKYSMEHILQAYHEAFGAAEP